MAWLGRYLTSLLLAGSSIAIVTAAVLTPSLSPWPTPTPPLAAASPSQPLSSEPVTPSPSPSPGPTSSPAPTPSEAPNVPVAPDLPVAPSVTPRPIVPTAQPAPVATPAPAIESLEARIAAVTGITRSASLTLRARAAQRVVEIQVRFEHGPLSLGEAEVIGYNRGYPDPLAAIVAGWLDSPDHAVILRDPVYTRIGCAWALGALDRYWFVCLLATDAAAVVAPLPTPCIPPPACGTRESPSVCLPHPMPTCPA
jgi:hypothetical protein